MPAIEEGQRERVIALVNEGGHDTALYRRVTLNRQQMGYLCALLEHRLADQSGAHVDDLTLWVNRVDGAMRRVVERERELSGLYHGGKGAAGIDHLLDYLGEVMAESDGHGLWDVEG